MKPLSWGHTTFYIQCCHTLTHSPTTTKHPKKSIIHSSCLCKYCLKKPTNMQKHMHIHSHAHKCWNWKRSKLMLIYMYMETESILTYSWLAHMYLCVCASGFSCFFFSLHSYFEVSLSFYYVFCIQIYFCGFVLYEIVFIRILFV